jgi:hypothetical protein
VDRVVVSKVEAVSLGVMVSLVVMDSEMGSGMATTTASAPDLVRDREASKRGREMVRHVRRVSVRRKGRQLGKATVQHQRLSQDSPNRLGKVGDAVRQTGQLAKPTRGLRVSLQVIALVLQVGGQVDRGVEVENHDLQRRKADFS